MMIVSCAQEEKDGTSWKSLCKWKESVNAAFNGNCQRMIWVSMKGIEWSTFDCDRRETFA